MGPATKLRVLIVDDDELIIHSMGARLEAEGFEVLWASDGGSGVERFREGVDAVLLDLALPDISGEEVFRRLRLVDPSVPVIMMTGHSTVPNAVDMMKAGLFHYAEKNADYMAKVVQQVRDATATAAHTRRRPGPTAPEDIIGASAEMRGLRAEVQGLLAAEGPVLVVGERGTGKRRIAQVLHHGGPRRAAPLRMFNCATLSSHELEVGLFGQDAPGGALAAGRPGALELARGGTIVLSQVSELAPALQSKLLDFLQTSRFLRRDGVRAHTSDVRLLSTTTHNLKQDVAERDFSNDLRLALGGHRPLEVPPLRERPDDIEALARHFLDSYRKHKGRSLKEIAPDAIECLRRQPWPGNVGELKNLVERAVLLCDGRTRLTEGDLLELSEPRSMDGFLLPDSGVELEEIERSFVLQALSRTGNNRTQAGKLLGLNRDQVRYRIKKFHIEDEPEEASATPHVDDTHHQPAT